MGSKIKPISTANPLPRELVSGTVAGLLYRLALPPITVVNFGQKIKLPEDSEKQTNAGSLLEGVKT